jgi:hypothetical protein
MNIDERLEKPPERHEAFTQTVELIATMQRDSVARWGKGFGERRAAIQQDGENIRALARVAEIYHERLSRLEDQQ